MKSYVLAASILPSITTPMDSANILLKVICANHVIRALLSIKQLEIALNVRLLFG
jgi:hypothetical protein